MRVNGIVKITVIIFAVFFALDMVWAFNMAVLAGRVLDSDGRPVAGAEVFVYDSPDTRRPADFISGRTGFDGRFRLTVPAGIYWSVARLRSGGEYGPLLSGDKHSGEAERIEIGPNEVYEQDFTVIDISEAARMVKKTREDHYKLSGLITDKKGVPVNDVYAIAYRGDRIKEMPDYVSAWTNREGKYKLFLPAGRYYVGYAAEFPPVTEKITLKEVIIKSDVSGFNLRIDSLDLSPAGEGEAEGEK